MFMSIGVIWHIDFFSFINSHRQKLPCLIPSSLPSRTSPSARVKTTLLAVVQPLRILSKSGIKSNKSDVHVRPLSNKPFIVV